MNTQQTYELGKFKTALAVLLGVFTLSTVANCVFIAIYSVMGDSGTWVTVIALAIMMLYLAQDRLVNKGTNTYQRIENPFTRRYVKAITGNAVFGIVFWLVFIALAVFGGQ
ncbi:hypothetical protein [Vibrio owensii]|uniref:hypothetical protein n=1 Tax=Vibrio owensii TaxID=696485 RepID=UPI002FF163C8